MWVITKIVRLAKTKPNGIMQSVLPVIGVWLRPVERTVRVREVPSSNLGTPTNARNHRQPEAVILFKPIMYNAHGHKLRFPASKKAQFVTALGIDCISPRFLGIAQ